MAQSVEILLQEAHYLQANGSLDKAEQKHNQIVILQPGALSSWQFLSARAARRGDHKAASHAIRQYLKIDDTTSSAWQGLGINLMHLGEWEEASQAFKEAIKLLPGNNTNLLYLGGAAQQEGDMALAVDCLSLALQQMTAAEIKTLAAKAEPNMQKILLSAIEMLATHTEGLVASAGSLTGHLKGARWRLHEKAPPIWQAEHQRPERFFLPALPPQAWFDGDDLPWVKDIEAAFSDIAAEVEAALILDNATPYVGRHMAEHKQWSSLAGNRDWSAVHLYNGGKANQSLIEQFPKTLAILEAAPLCRVGDKPVEIFFSLLKAGTHIVPHHGTSNSRLTVHVPIQVPDGTCKLRVGEQTRVMEAGKVIAFDDSFDHEAYNNGDALRINLIFEAWHPALSKEEQEQLSVISEAYDTWFAGRGKRLDFLGISLSNAVRADQCFRQGEKIAQEQVAGVKTVEAKAFFTETLRHNPFHKMALKYLANMAFDEGNNKDGLCLLRRLGALSTTHAGTQYRLAIIEEQIGETSKALSAYLRCLKADKNNMIAYLYAGFFIANQTGENSEAKENAAQLYSIGQSLNGSLRHLHLDNRVAEETRRRSYSANILLSEKMASLHQVAVGSNGGRILGAQWPQTHGGPVAYKVANQKPHEFYIPDIIPIRYMDRAQMPWAEAIEAAYDDIKAELMAVLSETQSIGRPYLDADMQLGEEFKPIVGTMNWVALDLYQNGQPNEDLLGKFPKTLAALEFVPLVAFGKAPFEVFFSLLQAHQHIPPHFGLSNHGITVHLPLVVPKSCKIRVDEEWREWREGALIAFDDSFEHEAKNDSDDLRVVLIFEVWHPDLTTAEKAAICRSFNVRDKWLQARKIPDLEDVDL